MKFRLTRSSLRRGLLVGAPVALSIQCDAPQDETTNLNELVVHIEPGQFTEALNACLADDDACLELCDQILVEHGYTSHPGEAEIFVCNVTKQPSTVEVEISYSPYPVSVGCGVVMVDPVSEPTSIGAHYAALAELEEASVYSFIRLARDLQRHGAPAELVLDAVEAAHDEARHVAHATTLARAWGGTPPPRRRGEVGQRDLFTLAMENAVDGGVHETFGAAIAAHQAREARDPFIQSTMASIARDEARHAALARVVDRWARPRLLPDQRQAIEEAARAAAHQLAPDQRDAPATVAELAGFPSADQARALARELEARRRA